MFRANANGHQCLRVLLPKTGPTTLRAIHGEFSKVCNRIGSPYGTGGAAEPMKFQARMTPRRYVALAR